MSEEKKQPYRKLNYKRSALDDRDFPYKHLMRLERQQPLPEKVDLTEKPYYPDVYDQLDEGKCTAMAARFCKEFITRHYVKDYPDCSDDGFYYSELEAQGNVGVDAGSDGRTSCEVMLNVGIGPESLCPNDGKGYKTKPSIQYFHEASKHRIGAFYKLETLYQLQKCLAAGFPFVLGMYCPKQMMDEDFKGYLANLTIEKDAIVENGQLAGHQVSCVGYEIIDGVLFFKIRNSWNKSYALDGHFYISEDMMMSEWVADFYTYRLAREPGI